MNRLIIAAGLFILMAFPLKADDTLEVIILAGQSNMVGSAKVSELKGEKAAFPDNVEVITFAQSAGKDRRDKQFGPEVGFAKAIGEANPEKNYLLIKWAIGGTSQADWSPTWSLDDPHLSPKAYEIGSLYSRSLHDIKAALDGREYRIRGLLWMQGEADAKTLETAILYDRRMKELTDAFRRDLEAPDMRVVMALINPDRPAKYLAVDEVRTRMRALAASDPLMDLVDTDGLTRKADKVHYDTEGQLELGRRFARAWLQAGK